MIDRGIHLLDVELKSFSSDSVPLLEKNYGPPPIVIRFII
jgi:hypothetical protein